MLIKTHSSDPGNLFDITSYDYHLPEALIAQTPAQPRGSSRLLVIDRALGSWQHRRFSELPDLLSPNDLLVVNNSKVMRARLLGERHQGVLGDGVLLEPIGGGTVSGVGRGKVEFVMLEELSERVWEGLFKASAKAVPGFCFKVPTRDGSFILGKIARGSKDSPTGIVVAEFDRDPISAGAGIMPLPPYIRPELQSDSVEVDYQTYFAKELGSAAAPTAGLHFCEEVLSRLENRGISRTELTLHVGVGTFRPVKSSDVREHLMHEERYEVSSQAAASVNDVKHSGGNIVAVGTTSVRTLESAWSPQAQTVLPGQGRSRLFIRPEPGQKVGECFKVVDRLITNFHLPRSTLLMLVSAFAGRELILSAYEDAIREKYRFFSYGDAMLIL